MLNFTVGPVTMNDKIRAIGAEQIPYFRTEEFSKMMYENEFLIKKFTKADSNARTVFLTGSGTAAMEAAVINFFTEKDKVLVIDGGSFGHRFAELLKIYSIPHTIIRPQLGHDITYELLLEFDDQGYTGFLVNIDETSVGVLYDIKLISDFCKKNNIFLIVDAISSFLCDPFDMSALDVQVMITSSQKALACPPGISIIVMSPYAVERAMTKEVQSMYLNLRDALKNGNRGQTPFTPAVGTLIQINKRLKQIDLAGGVDVEIDRIRRLSGYFREKITKYPFGIFSDSLPNALTSLATKNGISAYSVFLTLKDQYDIWVCPNGGTLKDKIFRVGHIGNLDEKDYDILLDALNDMKEKKLI